MAILDFSFSWWHGFGSVTQVCFRISVSNFMCMSFVGRSLTIVNYVAFKMAALWFWTMPPSPMGRGILVDHWSTISSFFENVILDSDIVHYKYNIFVCNMSNTIDTWSALWLLMAWCFSTRASVATVLITHSCISRCLCVNLLTSFNFCTGLIL